MTRQPPQPSVDRLTPFGEHPIVAGVTPRQSALVALTAASLAEATRAPAVYFAYSDPTRYVRREFPDGSVTHESLSSDVLDDSWQIKAEEIKERLTNILRGSDVTWKFLYLAGRPDRALTHLARAVDAAVIVVGTRTEGRGQAVREFFEGSVAVHLAQHQHRPVLTVPLSVVDWKETPSRWEA